MRLNQVKWGAILSYVLMAVNTIYGLLATPFIIKCLGISSYGVYKSVASLSSSLAVVDLGLGVTMTRYMAVFNAKKDLKGASNFAAMVLVQHAILSLAIAAVGFGAYLLLPTIYGKTFLPEELMLAKQLLVIMVLNLLLRLLEGLFLGIARGFERFIFANSLSLIFLIVKITVVFVLLPIYRTPVLIVATAVACATIGTLVALFYAVFKLGVKPKLTHWDHALFKESLGYTVLMFIQTITVQFNGNVDNIVIGSVLGATSVTVYSAALALFGMYENLSGSIANIMLPNMARRVMNGDAPEQLQAGVEKAGRFQFMLLGAALGGFVILGKDFFLLWLGEGFEDCYWLALLLMIPVTFTMMQNVALSILRAQNKMKYRTVTLAISCCFNIVLTLVGCHLIGYWGAALGTACATISNLVFMNYYYHKHLKFKIFRLFRNVLHRLLPCAAAATLVTMVTHYWFHETWFSFLLNAGVFLAVYGVLLVFWGWSKEEKQFIFGRGK